MGTDPDRIADRGLAHTWFQEPEQGAESETWGRFAECWRVRRPLHVAFVRLFDMHIVSWFQEPLRIPRGGFAIVVSGTVSAPPTAAGGTWYQEPAGSWFQEPRLSWFWEPAPSWFQEPGGTWFREPRFVVSGTKARSNRNRPPRIRQRRQRPARLFTPLNGLTYLSNRISFNAERAEKQCLHAASWGLRPRRLAPPLRGSAPGANAPSHPASPKRGRAMPDKFSLKRTRTRLRLISRTAATATTEQGLSEESLAFSARDPRNREWAASTPKRGALVR